MQNEIFKDKSKRRKKSVKCKAKWTNRSAFDIIVKKTWKERIQYFQSTIKIDPQELTSILFPWDIFFFLNIELFMGCNLFLLSMNKA